MVSHLRVSLDYIFCNIFPVPVCQLLSNISILKQQPLMPTMKPNIFTFSIESEISSDYFYSNKPIIINMSHSHVCTCKNFPPILWKIIWYSSEVGTVFAEVYIICTAVQAIQVEAAEILVACCTILNSHFLKLICFDNINILSFICQNAFFRQHDLSTEDSGAKYRR